jgi:hypothetical protein
MIHQLVPAIKGTLTDPPGDAQSAFQSHSHWGILNGQGVFGQRRHFLLNKGVVVSERHDTTRTAKGSE